MQVHWWVAGCWDDLGGLGVLLLQPACQPGHLLSVGLATFSTKVACGKKQHQGTTTLLGFAMPHKELSQGYIG